MDRNGFNHEWTRMDTNEGAAGSSGFPSRALCWWSMFPGSVGRFFESERRLRGWMSCQLSVVSCQLEVFPSRFRISIALLSAVLFCGCFRGYWLTLPPHPRPLSPCGGEGGDWFLVFGKWCLFCVFASSRLRVRDCAAEFCVFLVGVSGGVLGWCCPLTPDPSPPAGARGGLDVSFR